jgi:ABC-type bacteriocin/lantibiotic exporter with double-glycine peptidase domain
MDNQLTWASSSPSTCLPSAWPTHHAHGAAVDRLPADGPLVRRLGDILNTRTEIPPTSTAQLPQLQRPHHAGQVHFPLPPEAAPVLNSMSLELKAGEVVGIVGRSGSGKSTLTKLVQRLYVPEGAACWWTASTSA